MILRNLPEDQLPLLGVKFWVPTPDVGSTCLATVSLYTREGLLVKNDVDISSAKQADCRKNVGNQSYDEHWYYFNLDVSNIPSPGVYYLVATVTKSNLDGTVPGAKLGQEASQMFTAVDTEQ